MMGLDWMFWLALLLLLVGLAGVVLPALPGVALMWVVILFYAIWERFAAIDPLTFAALTLLALVGSTADIWLSQLGARVAGASLWSTVLSLLGGLIGGAIGFLFAGVGMFPGVLIGSGLGVFSYEYYKQREWKAALKATVGLMIGFTVSVGVQLVIAVLMLVLFVWQVLRG